MPKKRKKCKTGAKGKKKTTRTKKKKTAKKTKRTKKKVAKKEKLIGRVTHFFDKIKVAAIKLNAPLKIGDQIRIVGGDTDFKQKVSSMEIEHRKVKRAKKGDEVGLKVREKVREGYRVFKL
ncbi:MAG: hypothetical protein LR000_01245 [Candidatus Pacebacteria bacterium]|nr:hypothetical protein [Candidatus Paceibacterota bacterium]